MFIVSILLEKIKCAVSLLYLEQTENYRFFTYFGYCLAKILVKMISFNEESIFLFIRLAYNKI